jgi:hypothetical protein
MLAVLLVAGCAGGPSYPLYSPRAVAQTFGYAEERVAKNRFRVTYAAPVRRTYPYAGPRREADAAEQLGLAYDMALWRASELALANGFPGFVTGPRDNEVQVDVAYDYYRDPFYDDPFYHYGHRRHRLYRHYPYDPYYYGGRYSRYALIAAKTTLTVELRKVRVPEAIDAATTIRRLRQKYPDALALPPDG